MEVCEVCGAFLIVGDAQSRVDDHLMGKQHMGYAKIKSTVEELKVRRTSGPQKRFLLMLRPVFSKRRLTFCRLCFRRNFGGARKTDKGKTQLFGRTEKTGSVSGRSGRKSAKRRRRRKRSGKKNARRSASGNASERETGNGTEKRNAGGAEATQTAATPVGPRTGKGADLVIVGDPEAETKTERGSAGAAGEAPALIPVFPQPAVFV